MLSDARADANGDAYKPFTLFLTLDVNTTHFNGLPPSPIFEISRIFSLPLLCYYK
jgi:hypothetical protein